MHSGLTQSDVAYLIGNKHHDLVSKLESRLRMPSLRIVIAYIIIFGVRLIDLIPCLVSNSRNKIQCRAQDLLPVVEALPASHAKDARLRVLNRLINQ